MSNLVFETQAFVSIPNKRLPSNGKRRRESCHHLCPHNRTTQEGVVLPTIRMKYRMTATKLFETRAVRSFETAPLIAMCRMPQDGSVAGEGLELAIQIYTWTR